MIEHDDDRAGGENALCGDIAIDGEDFFDRAALPVARAQRLGAADHQQPAAQLGDVAREEAVLVGRETIGAARDVGKDDRVERLEVDQARGELSRPDLVVAGDFQSMIAHGI